MQENWYIWVWIFTCITLFDFYLHLQIQQSQNFTKNTCLRAEMNSPLCFVLNVYSDKFRLSKSSKKSDQEILATMRWLDNNWAVIIQLKTIGWKNHTIRTVKKSADHQAGNALPPLCHLLVTCRLHNDGGGGGGGGGGSGDGDGCYDLWGL